MPTYEYKCLKCKKHFEAFQKMSDKPLSACIYCGEKVQRLIGAGLGIIFKGNGFYETDYKRKKQAPVNKKQGPSCQGCPDANCGQKKDK